MSHMGSEYNKKHVNLINLIELHIIIIFCYYGASVPSKLQKTSQKRQNIQFRTYNAIA